MQLGNVIFNKLKRKQWITWQKFLPIAGVARVWRPTSWAGPRPSRKSLNWLSEAKRTPGKIRLKAKQHRIIFVTLNSCFHLAPCLRQEKLVSLFCHLLIGSQAPPAPPRPPAFSSSSPRPVLNARFCLCAFLFLIWRARTVSSAYSTPTRWALIPWLTWAYWIS